MIVKRLFEAIKWNEDQWFKANEAKDFNSHQLIIAKMSKDIRIETVEKTMQLVENFDAETISKALVIAGYVAPGETQDQARKRKYLILGWAFDIMKKNGFIWSKKNQSININKKKK